MNRCLIRTAPLVPVVGKSPLNRNSWAKVHLFLPMHGDIQQQGWSPGQTQYRSAQDETCSVRCRQCQQLRLVLQILALLQVSPSANQRGNRQLTFKGKFKVYDALFCFVNLNAIVDLISPKNVTDSLQATFQRRPDRKHVYQQCMMMVMLVSMMAGMGEGYCEFMYTKRLFQWKVETYSYFNLIKARNSIIASLI